MASAELEDGGRLSAGYDWNGDWWTARIDGSEGVAEGHALHSVVRELLRLPHRTVSPPWLLEAVQRVAKRETALGRA